MNSKKFAAGVKSGSIKYFMPNTRIIQSWFRVVDVVAEDIARARRQAYFSKLKKWGEEVLEGMK